MLDKFFLHIFLMSVLLLTSCKQHVKNSEVVIENIDTLAKALDTSKEVKIDSPIVNGPVDVSISNLSIKEEREVKKTNEPKITPPKEQVTTKKPTVKTNESEPVTTPNPAKNADVKTNIEESKPSVKPKVEEVKSVEVVQNIPNKNVSPDHTAFNTILKSNVSETGVVNYRKLMKEKASLMTYIDQLSSTGDINSMPYEEKLAFWINLYNASTLALILDNYPLKSIKDIGNGKPWDKRFVKVGKTYYSLNEIENDIIRKKFGEPRIHFALNCAAKSCPPLANSAFTKENLNKLLEKQTKSFVNGNENEISPTSCKISSIFDWYAVDFGDINDYLNKYSSTKINPDAAISYKNYNWALNE